MKKYKTQLTIVFILAFLVIVLNALNIFTNV